VTSESSASAGDPFPLHSVQAVAALAWRLALQADPVGLLVVPFVIFFPVYVFVAQIAEIVSGWSRLALESPAAAASLAGELPFGAILGVLPLVIFAASFGETWLQVRADARARGDAPSYTATASRAMVRMWALAITTLIVYLLWQVAAFAFVLPGLVVYALTSLATRAAVLDEVGWFEALRISRRLVVRHWLAWLGLMVYWAVVFLGLGILVGIARFSVGGVAGGWGLWVDLLLGLPLPISLLVFETSWTLFFREIEARSREEDALAAGAPARAESSGSSAHSPA
jgi:hypothetical protein